MDWVDSMAPIYTQHNQFFRVMGGITVLHDFHLAMSPALSS